MMPASCYTALIFDKLNWLSDLDTRCADNELDLYQKVGAYLDDVGVAVDDVEIAIVHAFVGTDGNRPAICTEVRDMDLELLESTMEPDPVDEEDE